MPNLRNLHLRATRQLGGVHHRILYFFHGAMAAVSHGLMKERVVPPKEIEYAVERKKRFEANPNR